jgi:hypothetical protein
VLVSQTVKDLVAGSGIALRRRARVNRVPARIAAVALP